VYSFSKRAFDLALSLLLLILLSPLLAVLALAVRLDSPGPALFRQRRVGRNGREFLILKFRTMRTDAPLDTPTHLLADPSSCITRLGGFLRRTSLDELPQLFNILKGEMSFVGPRPALWNQFDLIEARERLGANRVPPGLTGLAQVEGRDELPIERKAELDGEYARTACMSLDMRILLRTVRAVAREEGFREGSGEGR
jgi:O-antigen biosynthesis protein WbqP